MVVCPRCKKSRRVIEVGKKSKGKHWLVTRCGKCAYNISIEEWKSYESDTTEKAREWKGTPRHPAS